jgi:hypothetical protein
MQPIAASLFDKIEEQIERTRRLVALLPEERIDWRPAVDGAWSAAELLGHLCECLSGFCAALYAAYPGRLPDFAGLRELPARERCSALEAAAGVSFYRDRICEGFTWVRDADLSRKLPTVFVPEGESLMTLLLGNLEHLINHKYQLFMYLKLIGVSVTSRDLYHFRG